LESKLESLIVCRKERCRALERRELGLEILDMALLALSKRSLSKVESAISFFKLCNVAPSQRGQTCRDDDVPRWGGEGC